MYVQFNQLPDSARVWVYQASRELTDAESEQVRAGMEQSLTGWAAHGQALLASAQVVANRFVVLGVDEGFNLPSGCSIDASVRMLTTLAQQLSQSGEAINFTDRAVALVAENGAVSTIALPAVKAAVTAGQLTPDTLLYDTLVQTAGAFRTGWQVRAGDSWLKRYFTPVAA
ncbi:hypothetical protein [Spirosoma rhododendri]|uniref:ABC transporter ATPase n=1 Tax=Spirosoma rhododendri TaxID=2728024 RepID=A0A7L5DK97_9BACT|nr:hypothetical protein [Spirosoma rhododendri]QJD77921.1 hypothetical protein HH216_05390 [Spirosoma rhododendri]